MRFPNSAILFIPFYTLLFQLIPCFSGIIFVLNKFCFFGWKIDVSCYGSKVHTIVNPEISQVGTVKRNEVGCGVRQLSIAAIDRGRPGRWIGLDRMSFGLDAKYSKRSLWPLDKFKFVSVFPVCTGHILDKFRLVFSPSTSTRLEKRTIFSCGCVKKEKPEKSAPEVVFYAIRSSSWQQIAKINLRPTKNIGHIFNSRLTDCVRLQTRGSLLQLRFFKLTADSSVITFLSFKSTPISLNLSKI